VRATSKNVAGMPTLTLEGPRSNPSLTGPTDPITPPPRTRVAPRPAPSQQPVPQPVRARRRGRAVAFLVCFAAAGIVTGGTLAWLGVTLPNQATERPPTARAAMRTIRSFGDYTTAPRSESVTVTFSDDFGILTVLFPSSEASYSVDGTIAATVPLRSVDRPDVAARRRTIVVRLPRAELGEAVVDRSSIRAVDDGLFQPDVSDREIAARATDEIRARALDADLPGHAERAVRRLLVHRLHALGFVHARVLFV